MLSLTFVFCLVFSNYKKPSVKFRKKTLSTKNLNRKFQKNNRKRIRFITIFSAFPDKYFRCRLQWNNVLELRNGINWLGLETDAYIDRNKNEDKTKTQTKTKAKTQAQTKKTKPNTHIKGKGKDTHTDTDVDA